MRSFHFRAASKLTPQSEASSARFGQHFMTARKLFMPGNYGHIVHKVKDRMSSTSCLVTACPESVKFLDSMAKKLTTPTKYREAFCERLQRVRISAGYTQASLARELKIDKDTYAKYESRSLLPHHLIPAVCELTHTDAWFLLTGKAKITRLPPRQASG